MATPAPQSYPVSKISVGAVLYSCIAWTEKGKTTSAIEQWIVRSIQSRRGTNSRRGLPVRSATEKTRYVNLTQKVEHVTWGKLSRKTGDYGWRKSIPALYRRQFAVGAKLPMGIYTTVRAALVFEIADMTQTIAWYAGKILTETQGDGLLELQTELAECEAEREALKRRLAKLNTLRAKERKEKATAAASGASIADAL